MRLVTGCVWQSRKPRKTLCFTHTASSDITILNFSKAYLVNMQHTIAVNLLAVHSTNPDAELSY